MGTTKTPAQVRMDILKQKQFRARVQLAIRKGYTQMLLAEILGVTDQTISDWKLEKKLPRINVVRKKWNTMISIVRSLRVRTGHLT